MSPQERAGFAEAINQAIDQACTSVRQENVRAIADVRREAEQVAHSLEQRAERAEARADRADSRADQLQIDLDATREMASEPAIRTALMDADGVLHVVQRSGPPMVVRLADFQSMVDAAVELRLAEALPAIEQRATDRLDAGVARGLLRMGDAPCWLKTAFYGPGSIVSCYSGRTYELRAGVAASTAQEPGDNPKVWARIGSHGMRVLKSKPDQVEAGDWFADGDSRFLSDGNNTVLTVPKFVKESDLKPLATKVSAIGEIAGAAKRIAEQALPLAQRADETAQRADQAANDLQSWVRSDGDQAVLRSATSEAWIVDRADDIDDLLDREAG